ncbi:hypothetical protein LWC35_15205 [Pseudonocardia kujensis]|uniref:hypothetical protein n=1 Tax=Pseudonocardia kujensis TaxID=1128675 RepID=UPI001E6206BB|nr:hypothetical protein [Pseudonocardia kujensis]MCE0764249.1 hypothetical protein [Pseudonocardia kujensis]
MNDSTYAQGMGIRRAVVGDEYVDGALTAEIREVLLQVAAYCGFPATPDGFETRQAILEAETGPVARPAPTP